MNRALRSHSTILYSVQWQCTYVSAVSTEKCVSVCQWLIAVLAQQLWGSRPQRDVSVAMETVEQRRSLDIEMRKGRRGRWWTEADTWEEGKILHSWLSRCIGMFPDIYCVCVSKCRVNKSIYCRFMNKSLIKRFMQRCQDTKQLIKRHFLVNTGVLVIQLHISHYTGCYSVIS